MLEKKRILVVEDEQALLATLHDELVGGGFSMEPAITGEEALRKCEERLPDAVLLDLLLPGSLNGIGVLEQLKKSERTRRVPVIILSNVGEEETVRAALDLGAAGYFMKTRHHLLNLLERIREVLAAATAD